MAQQYPKRGEIWEIELQGGGGNQLALVLSTNTFNGGPAGSVIVLWITPSRLVRYIHIEVKPAESGLNQTIYIECDEIETVKKPRFQRSVGTLGPDRMREIENTLRTLLEFQPLRRR